MANRFIRRFLRRDEAAISVLGLFFFASSVLLASYAIDVSNVEAQRTLMQATADSAAHDALVTREFNSRDDSITAAVNRANAMMPEATYGIALRPEDVVFGTWDTKTRTFTADNTSRKAVQVKLRRTAAGGNAVKTYLMRLVGVPTLDVVMTSTFATYQPQCLREGFVAEGVVDVQSNNNYFNGFCIHSNTYVSLNSNNYFEPGTVVSMPDLSLLELPKSGYDTNIGLTEALRQGSINIKVLRRIQKIINDVSNPNSPYYPTFLTDPTPRTITKGTITAADLVPGHIYNWSCNTGNGGTIDNGAVVTGVVIIANCPVKLGNGSAMEDAVLLTTDTSAKSINSPNGFRLGRNDNCAPGGGARIVSLGGMDFAAALEMYGSQLLGMGDIVFAAQANGIQGASMISNGVISGTSNMSMSYCNGNVDEFTAAYFHMVQ